VHKASLAEFITKIAVVVVVAECNEWTNKMWRHVALIWVTCCCRMQRMNEQNVTPCSSHMSDLTKPYFNALLLNRGGVGTGTPNLSTPWVPILFLFFSWGYQVEWFNRELDFEKLLTTYESSCIMCMLTLHQNPQWWRPHSTTY
jgi:hypothetical protein